MMHFSRFPTDPTVPTPAPPCTQGTLYEIKNRGKNSPAALDLILTIDRTKTCGSGYQIVNVCGVFNDHPVTFKASDRLTDPLGRYTNPENCLDPSSIVGINMTGFDFETALDIYNMQLYTTSPGNEGYYIEGYATMALDGLYKGTAQALACGSSAAACT